MKNWDINEHDFSGDNKMKNNQTRRTFFRNASTAGLLAASVGGTTVTAHAASLGKKILADETMLEQYLKKFQKRKLKKSLKHAKHRTAIQTSLLMLMIMIMLFS